MSLELAVIADDFTGALDCSTPFALAGLSVAAATRPEWLEAALVARPDVVVVSTASRALPPDAAVARVRAVAARLRAEAPAIVFKKIDSRLKGNVAAEIAATVEAVASAHVVVAPAIPDQGRPTIDGRVTGRGVAAPIAIAPLVPPGAEIVDAATDADLDRLVQSHDWGRTLAVGARGLGAALARRFGPLLPTPFAPDRRVLFAIGSRDPITAAQVARLDGIDRHEAPGGRFAGRIGTLPALLESTGPFIGPDEATSRRFAAAVHATVEDLRPDTLVMSGGDTALAILDALDIGVIFPRGEALSGLPWFTVALPGRPPLRCVVKSGGFGDEDVLAALLPDAG